MPKPVINFLYIIFLDNFYFSLVIFLLLVSFLLLRRFLGFRYPYSFAIFTWSALVIIGSLVAVLLLLDFFSHGKGMERLTLVPLILGASPLFVCTLAALFIFPKK